MRHLLAVPILALLAGCGLKPPPKPPEPPDPTPPPVEAPQPQCAEGQTHSCWHLPPDSRTWLYACPLYNTDGGIVGTVDVVGGPAQCPAAPPPPDPEPPPATDCQPVLDPAKSAPVASDSSWPPAADQTEPSLWKQSVWDAVRAAKAACAEAWSGDCLVGGPPKIDYGYLLISKELQDAGIDASQAIVGGERKDHLWVRRAPGSNDWNGTKLFNYGSGCLITGDGAFNVHGWYTYAGGGTQPEPEPPPVAGCSSPLPPKVWTEETLPDGYGSDAVGQPRWELGCGLHPNGRVVDCTAKVAPHACDYCAAIGMGEISGQPRCGCPVRNECKPAGEEPQNFKCEERVACEAYLTGGTKLQSRNGATCEFANNNPFQFFPNGGNCQLCSVGDPRVCGDWF
jgi:hypothetical protein